MERARWNEALEAVCVEWCHGHLKVAFMCLGQSGEALEISVRRNEDRNYFMQ